MWALPADMAATQEGAVRAVQVQQHPPAAAALVAHGSVLPRDGRVVQHHIGCRRPAHVMCYLIASSLDAYRGLRNIRNAHSRAG